MTEEERTTIEEARRVGDEIGVDRDRFELEQFSAGMDVEYEHSAHDPQTNVTGRSRLDGQDRAGAHEGVPRLLRAPGERGRGGRARPSREGPVRRPCRSRCPRGAWRPQRRHHPGGHLQDASAPTPSGAPYRPRYAM